MAPDVEQGETRQGVVTADDKIAALTEEFSLYKAVNEEKEKCREKVENIKEKLSAERESRWKERLGWLSVLFGCLAIIFYLAVSFL